MSGMSRTGSVRAGHGRRFGECQLHGTRRAIARELRRASRRARCTCTKRAVHLDATVVHLHGSRRALGRDHQLHGTRRALGRSRAAAHQNVSVHLPGTNRALARFTPCTCTLHAVHLHLAPRLRPVRSYGIDVIAIVVFAILGRRNHDEGTAVTGILVVAWPFVAGWTIAWFATRLHRRPESAAGALRALAVASRSPSRCASPPTAASHPRSSSWRACSSGWCSSGGGGWWRWSAARRRARPSTG